MFFDRSPVCTHALAMHLGLPITAAWSSELDRIRTERVYERHVFPMPNLDYCEPTAARRISFQDALKLEQIHEHSYCLLGYQPIDIPAESLDHRIATIHREISRLAE